MHKIVIKFPDNTTKIIGEVKRPSKRALELTIARKSHVYYDFLKGEKIKLFRAYGEHEIFFNGFHVYCEKVKNPVKS